MNVQGSTRFRKIVAGLTLVTVLSGSSVWGEVLTLKRALDIAMQNSPDMKQAELDLVRSQESLNAQNASLKTSFRLQLTPFSYSKDRTYDDFSSTWYENDSSTSSALFSVQQPLVATDGVLSLNNRVSWQNSFNDNTNFRDKSFYNNLYLSFEQPIFTYNRTKMELSELELDLENTKYTYAISKLTIEEEVTRTFYEVYQARMNLNIANEELSNNQESYTIIKNKVDAGLSAMEELYQAELDLLNSQLTVQDNRETLDNALDSFKLLIGVSLDEDIDISSDEIEHTSITIELDKALNNALQSRMELRQREITIETALNNLTRTAAENEFEGNIVVSYGLIGQDETFGSMYENPTNQQAVSVSFDIPLWDWGEKKSRIKASEATVSRQRYLLEDERNQIKLALRSAYRSLEKLETQIEIARQSLTNAQLTYDINLERYKNGDLTSMDLSLYQTQLSERKTSLLQSLINYKLALLNMKILSLWNFETNEPVLPDLGD